MPPPEQPDQALQSIPLLQIDVPEQQRIRAEHNPEALTELAHSLERHGQLQPIVVAQDAERFTLIAGGRRLAAAKQLGWASISAVVHDQDALDRQPSTLAENLHRAQLSPIEEAAAVKEIIDDEDPDIDALAKIGRAHV